MKAKVTATHEAVRQEALRAYSHDDKTRQLHWRAPHALPRDQARAVLAEALPHGYNDFHADLLKKLPRHAHVTLARENSVCLYVAGKHPRQHADEVTYDDQADETRLWWD